ncbi:epidermal growth factor receptor substrate 15-like 1 isoform X1 [Cucurbita maxima]|uniref:Epidermal growth factor receptor substrate 15-like 1 isoform X1 n=1 Tax=Cucurbita maxima TaxID=3661 RepID=A0A6J1IWA8_CUCMA|nr:epidermal growth factor receptor substrate 15-like 1 isoform X1 [Cucurbita maxima]
MDQFDAFFRRADLDGDGRISGAEAVAFFQGSNLPKNVLAQIWMHADQRKTGFLGRPEFYNALRLVTVAQSKRELTPDIVKAALYGPAAAKIPPPKIVLPAVSTPQSTSVPAASPPQMSMPAPTASQNFGFRGQGVPSVGVNQQHISAQPNPSMRLPQATPGGVSSSTQMVVAAAEHSGGGHVRSSSLPNTNDWLGGRPGGALAAGPRGVSPSVPSPATSLSSALVPSQPMPNDRALAVSGNGFTSKSAIGADMFSITPSPHRPDSTGLNNTANGSIGPSAIVPVSSVSQPFSQHKSMESLQSAFVSRPLSGAPLQLSQSPLQLNQSPLQLSQSALEPTKEVRATGPSPLISSGITTGARNSTSEHAQVSWPKMKPTDVQKYTKVFMEVDTDRDGRITGEQARNLFLSWRLPREVLKQVWDLSDQDNDSMLSLREFSFALYLMERYREGRPLPAVLPNNVMFDETLLSMTGQPNVVHPNVAWGPHPGFGQQQPQVAARSMAPTAGLRPPTNVPASKAGGARLSNAQKSRTPVLEDSFLDQSDKNQQNSASPNAQDATASEKKVGETDNVILDSREKIEFYRTMMQELVLHKSRCDNRLNEITERASADRREAETLGKKYEEKYKQVADLASKLTIEEANYRDVQERKAELHEAIIKMEQGGSADGILQVRADRIQSDIELLLKALTERCKRHGIDVKSAAMIELPVGWQPGIADDAAVWDEEWDKFEDEGFSNDLNLDPKRVSASKPKMSDSLDEKDLEDYNSTLDSSFNGNDKTKVGIFSSTINHGLESEFMYSHSEDESARSPYGSPAAKTSLESPHEFSDAVYEKSPEAYRSFDESTWGAFDNNDDVDSVWGIKPVNTKESDAEKHQDMFGSGDFDTSSAKTASPNADSFFQTKSPFFEDSVPPTPLSRFGNSSSPRYSDVGDHFFDNSSRFDSFSMQDPSFSPQREKFSRFDSIGSSQDFGGNQEKFSRFDSISSSMDFGQSSQRHARFDSAGSSRDFSHSAFSFDDADPFGSSAPFKAPSENQSPNKSSDSWRAF